MIHTLDRAGNRRISLLILHIISLVRAMRDLEMKRSILRITTLFSDVICTLTDFQIEF